MRGNALFHKVLRVLAKYLTKILYITYWIKVQLRNPLTDVEVELNRLSDSNKVCSGEGDIDLFCRYRVKSQLDLIERVPVSTLEER